jgi:membrane fusion protein, multidrug efflux system
MNEKTKNRKLIVGLSMVGIVVVSFGLMMLLSSFKEEPPKKPLIEIIRHVKAQQVSYRDIESKVVGFGRLSSSQHVDVIAEVQGKILPGNVPLKKGQPFKKGALLFKIFDGEARLTLLSKKSRFLNSIANLLPDFKVDFPGSYEKWTRFLGAIDIEKELPDLPSIASPKEKIFLAGRNILSDYYSIKSEEVRMKKYRVQAPFSGTFTEVALEAGSVANAGSRVGKIIRTDQLELEVPVETYNAGWISAGDPVTVISEDGTREWRGTVVRKADFISASHQSVSVFVGLESTAENPLLLGAYLKAVFPGIIVRNAMQMPRNAVFNENEVFVVEDGRLAKQQINIHKTDEKTLIFSGLSEGMDLVIEPLVNAAENSAVKIIGRDEKPDVGKTGAKGTARAAKTTKAKSAQ